MNKGDAVYTIYSVSNDIFTEGISSPQFLAMINIQPRPLLQSSTGVTNRGKYKVYGFQIRKFNIHLPTKTRNWPYGYNLLTTGISQLEGSNNQRK